MVFFLFLLPRPGDDVRLIIFEAHGRTLALDPG